MGKSPGKWIKTVLFGKKSAKSNLSKDATLDKKTSINAKSPPKDSEPQPDNMVISSPLRPVVAVSGEHMLSEKSSSASLTCDTVENVSNIVGLNPANNDEIMRLEQAASKVQASFRGYLARRAFWALKGIIRLQALVRGHLVRRQAVATLSCMRAIVEFQAQVRGQRVRHSGNAYQVTLKNPRGELVEKKRADLLGTSLRLEKLSTNAFVTKLVASMNTTTPLSIQYDPVEPNSVKNWLERWSYLRFWEPLPQPKKKPEAKPKRKQTKLQTEETETGRPKRSVRRIPAAILDNNPSNSSENEKPKRIARKVSSQQAEPVQEQSVNELEKVKRSLRRISVSNAVASEKSDFPVEKPPASSDKISISPTPEAQEPEQGPAEPLEKASDLNAVVVEQLGSKELLDAPGEITPVDFPQEDNPLIEPPSVEPEAKNENESPRNVKSNGKENHSSKENQKARRRKSFPAKQEHPESVPQSQNTPTLPSYMAATESAKAKLRAQAAAKAAEDGAENGLVRRHSLPSSTGKPSLQSPRVQKTVHTNGKGGMKSNKPGILPRDEKEKAASAGWRR